MQHGMCAARFDRAAVDNSDQLDAAAAGAELLELVLEPDDFSEDDEAAELDESELFESEESEFLDELPEPFEELLDESRLSLR